jgi:hypothetical protein
MEPVIASAGADGKTGISNPPGWPSNPGPDPMTPDGTGADKDNIYSYRLQSK